jgi:hypothetical protein
MRSISLQIPVDNVLVLSIPYKLVSTFPDATFAPSAHEAL